MMYYDEPTEFPYIERAILMEDVKLPLINEGKKLKVPNTIVMIQNPYNNNKFLLGSSNLHQIFHYFQEFLWYWLRNDTFLVLVYFQ